MLKNKDFAKWLNSVSKDKNQIATLTEIFIGFVEEAERHAKSLSDGAFFQYLRDSAELFIKENTHYRGEIDAQEALYYYFKNNWRNK